MRPLVTIATIFTFCQVCFGQTIDSITSRKGNTECFYKIMDSVIINEIANFILAGSFERQTDSVPKSKVNEIPISNCTDTSVSFSKDSLSVNIYLAKFDTVGHKLTYVFDELSSNLLLIDNKPIWGTYGNFPKTKIKSIVIKTSKQKITLPENAIAGLYELNIIYYKDKKTNQVIYGCHAYRSLDNKRIYIHWLNIYGADGYEVTWIIQDNKYLTRIVDYVN